eukprot:170046_1
MAVDMIACILLLSTILWDLSSGRKGGLQSHREPLSILDLTTAVFYSSLLFLHLCLHLFEDTHIEITSILYYTINWFIMYNELSELDWINNQIIRLIRTSFRPIMTAFIIPIGTSIDTSLIISMIVSFGKSIKTVIISCISLFTAAINTSFGYYYIKTIHSENILIIKWYKYYSLKKRFKYIQIKRLKNKSIITSMMIWCSDPRQQQLEASYHHKIKKRFKYIQIKRLKNKSKNYYKIITSNHYINDDMVLRP